MNVFYKWHFPGSCKRLAVPFQFNLANISHNRVSIASLTSVASHLKPADVSSAIDEGVMDSSGIERHNRVILTYCFYSRVCSLNESHGRSTTKCQYANLQNDLIGHHGMNDS